MTFEIKEITPTPDCLKRSGVEIERDKVTSGTRGSLWKIHGDDSKLLKFTPIFERSQKKISLENYASQIADETKIGPRVYSTGICDDYFYIVVQKLSGPSLQEAYPFPVKYINRALNLYFTFLKNGLVQNDFHAGNLILDTIDKKKEKEQQRLYLIDYGDTINIDKNVSLDIYMREAILSLIGNLYNGSENDETVIPLYISAAQKWFYEKFQLELKLL